MPSSRSWRTWGRCWRDPWRRSGSVAGTHPPGARGGEKHRSHILKRQVRGKTQSLYVSVDLVEEAEQWVAEYRRERELLKEISELNRAIIGAHVSTQRALARNRAAAAPPAED